MSLPPMKPFNPMATRAWQITLARINVNFAPKHGLGKAKDAAGYIPACNSNPAPPGSVSSWQARIQAALGSRTLTAPELFVACGEGNRGSFYAILGAMCRAGTVRMEGEGRKHRYRLPT